MKRLGEKFAYWARDGKGKGKGHPRSVAAVTSAGPRKPKPSGGCSCGGCGGGCSGGCSGCGD